MYCLHSAELTIILNKQTHTLPTRYSQPLLSSASATQQCNNQLLSLNSIELNNTTANSLSLTALKRGRDLNCLNCPLLRGREEETTTQQSQLSSGPLAVKRALFILFGATTICDVIAEMTSHLPAICKHILPIF